MADLEEESESPARRICFYNHTAVLGGAEVVLCNVLRRVNSKAFRPFVVSPIGELSQACQELGIEHVAFGELRARFSANPLQIARSVLSGIRNVLRFRRLIRAREADIIYANTVRAGLVATLATIGTSLQVVWHIHDILPSHPVTSAICAIARKSRRTSLIAVSTATAKRFLQSGCSSKLIVIPNGTDPRLFHPDPEPGSELRESLGLSGSDFVIGMVGQIAPRKGQLGVVAAFSELSRRAPSAVLLIVGEPMFVQSNYGYLERVMSAAAAARHARIQFLGKRRDMRAVINALDIIVMNSSTEPFALVVLEGMACGKPVIAPAKDGFLEVIENGTTGYFVSPGNKASMIGALERCYLDREHCQAMGRNGEQRVLRDFTCDLQVARISEYLAGIVLSARRSHYQRAMAS